MKNGQLFKKILRQNHFTKQIWIVKRNTSLSIYHGLAVPQTGPIVAYRAKLALIFSHSCPILTYYHNDLLFVAQAILLEPHGLVYGTNEIISF